MTREIKFRARLRIRLGELPIGSWVYFTVQNSSFNNWIDWETLCEYTGLTDKNGKPIYEGDIVRDSSGIGQVGYSPPGFMVETGDPLRFWLGGGKEYPPNYQLKDTEVDGGAEAISTNIAIYLTQAHRGV